MTASTWRTGTTALLLSGLRAYTRAMPFARGRGLFIRPIELLARRGWPRPKVELAGGLTLRFERSLLGWTTFERGSWEPRQTALFLQRLHPGDTVVVVGANTGYFVLLAAEAVGDDGAVHAFEIEPSIAGLLEQNVRDNGFEGRVKVQHEGCFSSVSEASIDSSGDPGSASLKFGDGGPRVRLTTLDAYVRRNPSMRVDFLLIDVEGADLEVLRGASDTLRRWQPIVMTEVHHLEKFGGSEVEMRAFMDEHGYEASEVPCDFSRDLLFTPRSAARHPPLLDPP